MTFALSAIVPPPSIEAIQREVASYFHVEMEELKGPRRYQRVTHARMVAMYLARKLTRNIYPEIGSRFGGRDHTTVMSAVRKIGRDYAGDPTLIALERRLDPTAQSPALKPVGCESSGCSAKLTPIPVTTPGHPFNPDEDYARVRVPAGWLVSWVEKDGKGRMVVLCPEHGVVI